MWRVQAFMRSAVFAVALALVGCGTDIGSSRRDPGPHADAADAALDTAAADTGPAPAPSTTPTAAPTKVPTTVPTWVPTIVPTTVPKVDAALPPAETSAPDSEASVSAPVDAGPVPMCSYPPIALDAGKPLATWTYGCQEDEGCMAGARCLRGGCFYVLGRCNDASDCLGQDFDGSRRVCASGQCVLTGTQCDAVGSECTDPGSGKRLTCVAF